MARSKQTPEVKDTICARIADGESLRAISKDEAMPGRRTVLEWLEQDEAFRAKYARAREAQGDHMDDLILETATACTEATVGSSRIKIDAYKWRAAKLRPKVYGDKQLIGSDPDNPLPPGFTVNLVRGEKVG